jgi:hypothetical protein
MTRTSHHESSTTSGAGYGDNVGLAPRARLELDEALPWWHRRGWGAAFDGAEKCVRTQYPEDGTIGFFVARPRVTPGLSLRSTAQPLYTRFPIIFGTCYV